MTETTAMFYVVETEYVGPNAKQHEFVDSHKIEITTKPERKNFSKEICIEGWCGTTNDWSVTAHGQYATLEEARAIIKEKFGEVRIFDLDKRDTDVLEMYKPGKYDILSKEVTLDWVYEAIRRDVHINTTNKEIYQLAAEYEEEANEQGATLDDSLEEIIENRRRELREEDEAYLTIDMDKWPETWEHIKTRLKDPERHSESGWLKTLDQEILSDSSTTNFLYSHEISQFHTASGNPEHVDIPVIWKL